MKIYYWYCFELGVYWYKKQCKKPDKMPKSDTITESTEGERKNVKERLTLGGDWKLWTVKQMKVYGKIPDSAIYFYSYHNNFTYLEFCQVT